ncbi:hypothetical protein PoB_004174100 [Plakobranchus ocellatus]|uniref:Uncharacterized protein n=1 Tax=Plakobranchus ocellatus TaxID=259542 RepID=A0AAV4AVW2_9GAST|nr:hypothetical protein PoB_004174100 [Plakobranchus ocellatus]
MTKGDLPGDQMRRYNRVRLSHSCMPINPHPSASTKRLLFTSSIVVCFLPNPSAGVGGAGCVEVRLWPGESPVSRPPKLQSGCLAQTAGQRPIAGVQLTLSPGVLSQGRSKLVVMRADPALNVNKEGV